jgi:hypothetical protein
MSRAAKILIVSFVGVACVALAVFLLRQSRGQEVTLTTASDQPLSESQAIELSREALERTGHETSKLAPQRFQRDNTNYYARNTISPYNGYVLWASADTTNNAFAVHMEQRGNQLFCLVSMPK